MKQFTILHTIETGGPGGAESVLFSLADAIDHRRFRSLALVPYEGWLSRQLEGKGIPTIVSKSTAWYDPTLLKKMIRLVWREGVDLIHSHLADQNFYSCLVGAITGTKTVVTYHGMPGLPESGKLRGRFKLRVVRSRADATVVVSDYLKKALVNLEFSADQITRIYNGVDVARFGAAKTGQLLEELGYRNGTKLVGMIANLRESKGYEYFIKAARKVADLNPHVRFIAVGEADRATGDKMRKLVEEMGLQDRVRFLGFRQDVPMILGDLDLFVLSSVSEGFSLASIEAMAAAKPVIATRSGGPEEIIDDGATGALVPPADADALAAKICELLANPESANQLGSSGQTKVATTFSMKKMVANYETLYDRLLNGK